MISTSRTSDFQISGSAISSHKNIHQEIVPLTTDYSVPVDTQLIQASSMHLRESRDSRNMISITMDDNVIHAGSTVSDESLLRILKAVRHA